MEPTRPPDSFISDYHGMDLWTPVDPNGRDNENGILFYCEYLFLKNSLNILTQEDKIRFNTIVRNLRTYRNDGTRLLGLFDRGAKESFYLDPEDRNEISHDNITAIAAFSARFNLPYHRYIFLHGKENQWRFDNAYPDKPRWSRLQHPRDIIYYSMLGGGRLAKSIAWCFMWFFYLTQIISCAKRWHVRPSLFHRVRTFLFPKKYPDSGYRAKHYANSGKLMAYVRMYPLRKHSAVARLVWKLCVWLVDRHKLGGYAYVFESYFHNKQHPVRTFGLRVTQKNKL